MATEPPIGTRIKRARERKRMRQQDLADALRVSRTTVDAWENGRSYPKSSIGALEAILGVNLTDGSSVTTYADPDEAAIWAMESFTPEERHKLIEYLREIRG